MKRWFPLFLALLAFTLIALPAQADSEPSAPVLAPLHASITILGPDAQDLAATQVVTGTPKMTGTVRIATLLATYFTRDVQEILSLHAQDFGFGQIAKALFTAVEANVPLDQILQMRLQDVGWGEIRKQLGLPPGMPHKSLGAVVSQGRGHHKGPDWMPPGQAKKLGKWTPPGQQRSGGKKK